MSDIVTPAERDFYLSQTALAKRQIGLLEKQKEFIDLQKKDLGRKQKRSGSIE